MCHVDPGNGLSLLLLQLLPQSMRLLEMLQGLLELSLLFVEVCQVVMQCGTNAHIVCILLIIASRHQQLHILEELRSSVHLPLHHHEQGVIRYRLR